MKKPWRGSLTSTPACTQSAAFLIPEDSLQSRKTGATENWHTSILCAIILRLP